MFVGVSIYVEQFIEILFVQLKNYTLNECSNLIAPVNVNAIDHIIDTLNKITKSRLGLILVNFFPSAPLNNV